MRTEVLTVSTSPVGLTEGIYKVANFGRAARAYPRALITVEGAGIRMRLDGQDAEAAVGGGHLISVGSTITLESASEIEKFSAVRSGGSDATLFISYLPRKAGA